MPTVRIQYKRFDCLKPECEFHKPDPGKQMMGRCTLLHVDMVPCLDCTTKTERLLCKSFQAKKKAS